MRARTYQIEMVRIRFPTDGHQVGTNVAVAVILPLSDQRMIMVAPRENLVGHEGGQDVAEIRIQRLGETALFSRL